MNDKIVLLVALAGFGWTAAAAADTESIWQPRIALTGGYDDNVLVTGQGGGSFAQVSPGLKLDVFGEHELKLGFDCQVGLAGLSNASNFDSLPDQNFPGQTIGLNGKRLFADENCALNTRVHLSERDRFNLRASGNYAQDPFALADLGLLLRPGQTDIFVGKLTVENTHALSGHTGINYGLDGAILTFGSSDQGNNYVLAPRVRYEWKTSQRSKWDVGVREQLFFGIGQTANPGDKFAGLLGEGHTLLLGYTYDLTQWADFTVRGGPALITASTGNVRNSGTTAMPTIRGEITAYTPSFDIHLVIGHDLVIGPGGGGALVGDIGEIGGTHRWEKLEMHLRAGAYRNANVFDQYVAGTSGYGGEVGFDWLFTKELKLGVSALRDARLFDDNAGKGSVDRDIIQVRLTYEKARFN